MNKKSKKTIFCSGMFLILMIAFDQLTKYLAYTFLKGKEAFELIPGVFELHYLENQSAAFGIDFISFIQKLFQITYFVEHPDAFLTFKMISFVILTLIVVVLLILLFLRIPDSRRFRYLNRILVAFSAGAIGNCIDRAVHKYVIDFFYFKLINFPIFNVADIYVTVSAFCLIIVGIFYYKEADYEYIFPSKKKKESL
jgi:signal peptidase II